MTMTNSGQWTRVIVLMPPSEEAQPDQLSESLQCVFAARDWFPIHRNDPYLAMAELCLREKAQTTRSAWGLQRIEQIALVIKNPDDWPDLSELTAAVNRYLPVATIWVATDTDVVPLSELSVAQRSEVGRLRGNNGIHAESESLTNQPDVTDLMIKSDSERRPLHAERSSEASERITREEIDMLLQMDESSDSL